MSVYAPYNFVPLSPWIFKPDWAHQVSHDLPFSDGISGTLEIEIKAHTPILIGGQQEQATDRQPGKVHFFKLPNGRYAIPGTSIKGMIRNVLEIASFGKMRLVDDQWLSVRDLTRGGEFYRKHLSKPIGNSTFRPLAQAGWLKLVANQKGGIYWQLIPCQYARVEQSDLIEWGTQQRIPNPNRIKQRQSAVDKYRLFKNALRFNFDLSSNQRWRHQNGRIFLEYAKATTLGSGTYEGQLVFTGQPCNNNDRGSCKHMEFIFYNDSTSPQKVEEKVMRAFQHIHADSDEWKYWYEKVRKGEKIPVFYLEKSGQIDSLGLAMMYRLPYQNTVGETIDHTNPDHQRSNFFDFPELIFGTVNEEESKFSLKSRVSFSMAHLEKQVEELNKGPTILGGPKASYYPSYVQQNNSPQLPGRNPRYKTYMDDDAKVRGWKRYPINPRWQVPQAAPQLSNKVKVSLYPLAEAARFKCYLDIHNLRKAELGALVWALTWGDNPKLRHGLGMGKPLGLGQVTIQIKPESWQQLRPTKLDTKVPDQKTCLQAFVDIMEEAYKKANTGQWANTEQLKQLLAMANQDKAPGQVEQLAYMSLPDFQQQKQNGWVLPPYVNKTGHRQIRTRQPATKTATTSPEVKVEISSELEKQLYEALFKAPNPSLKEANATKWYKAMGQGDAKEAVEIAKMLKTFYIHINKWEGEKISKKQLAKVESIKQVLGE